MGKYKIDFKPTALKHLQFQKKAGDKATIVKIDKLIIELENHPQTGTGKPEKLKGDLSSYWSRRINHKDRMLYTIEENIVTVTVFSTVGHYE